MSYFTDFMIQMSKNVLLFSRSLALPTIVSVLIYGSYVQFSPQMGNVWIRNGSFRPINLFRLMVNPFSKSYLWRPSLIDLNWLVHLLICITVTQLYQNSGTDNN